MPTYICIDLKSFYASVECVQRGLNPLDTNLVVADETRTDKTICLAVTPSLKTYGIPGRVRLFEVKQMVEEVNQKRLRSDSYHEFTDSSYHASRLEKDSSLKLDFLIAPPQMTLYKKISNQIYEIYLRYISSEDIHVYSIDEVFMDVTGYLQLYHCTAHDLAMRMIRDVLKETGITATAGIGTNLYLAKIAMDIVAKKMPPDADGVRIAELDEMSFRKQLWSHTPLTDFWSTGRGTERRLHDLGLYTMGDIARFSEYGEKKLFDVFGVKAALLIDHAWGYESCTLREIKSYMPSEHSLSEGQVLKRPYSYVDGKLIVKEMTERLMLELVRKHLVTEKLELRIGYDGEDIPKEYTGPWEIDRYGRRLPKTVHHVMQLECQTASTKLAIQAMMQTYAKIVNPTLFVRRINVVAMRVTPESQREEKPLQYSLFDDVAALEQEHKAKAESLEKEKNLQAAMLSIQDRFGKNAILKASSFQEQSTAIERNGSVGGHRA